MTAPADLQTTLRILRENRSDLRARKHVELLGVFGSLARGEATPESDVDVLADFLKGSTLFDVSEAQMHLEEVLGRRVDLVDRAGLRDFVRPSVERDLVPV